ncbi:MAG: hypothetical protein WAK29_13760 [Terriglobales bacterium]
MNALVPQKAADHEQQGPKHERHHAVYAAEATGLLLMAVLLLILIIIRYWHFISWSAR